MVAPVVVPVVVVLGSPVLLELSPPVVVGRPVLVLVPPVLVLDASTTTAPVSSLLQDAEAD